jgi:hypothetical protein
VKILRRQDFPRRIRRWCPARIPTIGMARTRVMPPETATIQRPYDARENCGSCAFDGAGQPTLACMAGRRRKARVEDVHELAGAMPHVTVQRGSFGNPVYQVGGKSFVFFRTARSDAVDPDSGQRYDDVIVFWVPSEADKQALIQDETTPFFTTAHFNGHPSVLVRASRLGEMRRAELAEVIEDAWLSQASARRAAAWLAEH